MSEKTGAYLLKDTTQGSFCKEQKKKGESNTGGTRAESEAAKAKNEKKRKSASQEYSKR